MPAQPLLRAAALVDEIVAVIDQQLDLPVDVLVRPRPAQIWLPQRGSGDRERIDRVRLAASSGRRAAPARSASAAPAPASSPAREQLPFEPAGELPAVLDRPQPLRGRAPTPSRAARRCPPRSPSRRAVGRPRRRPPRSPTACVRPVRSRSSASPPSRWGRPASGQTSIEAKRPRSYQVTLDGLGRRRRHNAGRSAPRGDIRNRVSRRRPSLRQQSDAATATRMTLSSGMSLG